MRPVVIIAAILLPLGAVEATAYWWMHPTPAGLGKPVLAYRPGLVKPETLNPGKLIEEAAANEPAPGDSSNQPSTSTITPLSEVVANALPSLRCTTGTAARIDREDGVTIHIAFFEWDLSSSTNVLEAFKHLPEECMGSIGMTLIEKAPPRSYPIGHETLSFDHTVFRDQRGVVIHAFKGTWVSGANTLLGKGVRGGVEQWTQLRWKSALQRFRPAHARVVQGAVRGIRDPDLAWEAFEDAMLKDLGFQ